MGIKNFEPVRAKSIPIECEVFQLTEAVWDALNCTESQTNKIRGWSIGITRLDDEKRFLIDNDNFRTDKLEKANVDDWLVYCKNRLMTVCPSEHFKKMFELIQTFEDNPSPHFEEDYVVTG